LVYFVEWIVHFSHYEDKQLHASITMKRHGAVLTRTGWKPSVVKGKIDYGFINA
jgi:hypothetical protein